MGAFEWSYTWTAAATATTGALTAVEISGVPNRFTFYFTTGPGCTATVQMQTGAESTLSFVNMGSSAANLSTSACEVHQFVGPFQWLRPYVAAKTTGVLKIHGYAT